MSPPSRAEAVPGKAATTQQDKHASLQNALRAMGLPVNIPVVAGVKTVGSVLGGMEAKSHSSKEAVGAAQGKHGPPSAPLGLRRAVSHGGAPLSGVSELACHAVPTPLAQLQNDSPSVVTYVMSWGPEHIWAWAADVVGLPRAYCDLLSSNVTSGAKLLSMDVLDMNAIGFNPADAEVIAMHVRENRWGIAAGGLPHDASAVVAQPPTATTAHAPPDADASDDVPCFELPSRPDLLPEVARWTNHELAEWAIQVVRIPAQYREVLELLSGELLLDIIRGGDDSILLDFGLSAPVINALVEAAKCNKWHRPSRSRTTATDHMTLEPSDAAVGNSAMFAIARVATPLPPPSLLPEPPRSNRHPSNNSPASESAPVFVIDPAAPVPRGYVEPASHREFTALSPEQFRHWLALNVGLPQDALRHVTQSPQEFMGLSSDQLLSLGLTAQDIGDFRQVVAEYFTAWGRQQSLPDTMHPIVQEASVVTAPTPPPCVQADEIKIRQLMAEVQELRAVVRAATARPSSVFSCFDDACVGTPYLHRWLLRSIPPCLLMMRCVPSVTAPSRHAARRRLHANS